MSGGCLSADARSVVRICGAASGARGAKLAGSATREAGVTQLGSVDARSRPRAGVARCGTTRNVQAHHARPVIDGGAADAVGVPLCARCHGRAEAGSGTPTRASPSASTATSCGAATTSASSCGRSWSANRLALASDDAALYDHAQRAIEPSAG